jgi:hypothetical protein
MKLKTVKLKMFKFKNCSNFKIFKFENTYFKKIQIKSKVENHKKSSKPKLLRTSSQTGKKSKTAQNEINPYEKSSIVMVRASPAGRPISDSQSV